MKSFVYKLFRCKDVLIKDLYRRWNKLYFKLIGIKYGAGLNVSNKIYILGAGKINIGKNFAFSSGGCINPVCRNLRGVMNVDTTESSIEIGDNVGISSSCLWAKERISIGNNVNIGGDSIIIDNDAHPHDYLKRHRDYVRSVGAEEYYKSIPTSPIIIEDDVWIGARCLILKGAHIGARSIIAAGSVVTSHIPSDVMAGGNPCKVIKSLI